MTDGDLVTFDLALWGDAEIVRDETTSGFAATVHRNGNHCTETAGL